MKFNFVKIKTIFLLVLWSARWKLFLLTINKAKTKENGAKIETKFHEYEKNQHIRVFVLRYRPSSGSCYR